MKIAVTYDEKGNVFQHFGHTEMFKIYDIQDGKVVASNVIGTDGNGHGALAGFLRNGGIDALICGGIGGGAVNALTAQGITIYGGVSGSADQAIADLLAKNLQYSSEASCGHHGHDHTCGH